MPNTLSSSNQPRPSPPPRPPAAAVDEMSPDGGVHNPSPPPLPVNFHLLEVTLISAQDLFPASRAMRTYAVTWVHHRHRLRTRVDAAGHTDPTWNDKFVFRVDGATLASDTSAVQVDIYAARPRFLPGPDTLLGTARAILSTLNPSPSPRFVALQVRRPLSLRPQGILNIGVALINADSRIPPFCADHGVSALAYHDLVASAPPAKEVYAALPRLQSVDEGVQIRLERTGSGENERVVLEKTLKKWRSELSSMDDIQDRGGWDNTADSSPEMANAEGSFRRAKQRRPRAMSCFNLAGQYADEFDSDDDGSSSCSSHR